VEGGLAFGARGKRESTIDAAVELDDAGGLMGLNLAVNGRC